MSQPKFEFGDRVRHARRPEWGMILSLFSPPIATCRSHGAPSRVGWLGLSVPQPTTLEPGLASLRSRHPRSKSLGSADPTYGSIG